MSLYIDKRNEKKYNATFKGKQSDNVNKAKPRPLSAVAVGINRNIFGRTANFSCPQNPYDSS
jgi:hypothetical protein